MPAKREHIKRLLVQIAFTLEHELDCEEAQGLQSELVDTMLAGQSGLDRFALVVQHLRVCIPCAEEFEILRQCAEMELEASWPTVAALLEKASRPELDA